MTRPVLFLDDGGVISDNSKRAPQWQHLVGEFFPPILGGTPDRWSEANLAFTTAIFQPGAWEARLAATPDYWSFQRNYALDWMTMMCELVDIPCPSDAEALSLLEKANSWIIPRVRADFPGVVDTIRLLKHQGYTLHTASGEASTELAGYLGALDVRDCFTRLYGPDLINTLKAGPLFYERLLLDASVLPSEALFVDDSPSVISWVAQVGARGVLVDSDGSKEANESIATIRTLAELPAVLDSIG